MLLVRLGGHAAGVFDGAAADGLEGRTAASSTAAIARADRARGASRAAARARRARRCRRRPTSPCACSPRGPGASTPSCSAVTAARSTMCIADPRLASLRPLVAGRVLDVPDPRLHVLRDDARALPATIVRPSGHDLAVNRAAGMVAAGHPLTAEAGARVLREGGNAVDAAVGAVLASWAAEPLLTGPGAGGYMLVAGRRRGADAAGLLRRGARPGRRPARRRADLRAGRGLLRRRRAGLQLRRGVVRRLRDDRPGWRPRSSAGARSTPPRSPAPAAALARDGRPAQRRPGLRLRDPRADPRLDGGVARRVRAATAARCARATSSARGELADTIERFGAEGAAPFYTGDLADAVVDWVGAGGGQLTRADLAAYEPVAREPVRATYRGRDGADQPAARRPAGRSWRWPWRAWTSARPARRRRSTSSRSWRRPRRCARPAFVGRARRAGLRRPPARRAPGLDDAHLGPRRRRPRVLGDVHQRRGLGPRRARHRHPRQQRHGRAGPQPAGLLHLSRRGGGCRR